MSAIVRSGLLVRGARGAGPGAAPAFAAAARFLAGAAGGVAGVAAALDADLVVAPDLPRPECTAWFIWAV